MSNHTPRPWELGDFDEHLGYDCMSAGVRCGPAVLDGNDYGQKRCTEMEPDAKARMMADAALIAAAPDLLVELDVRAGDLHMLRMAIEAGDPKAELLLRVDDMIRETKAAIAKAEGK